MMMCMFVLLALSVGFCAGSQRIYSDEGTLVGDDNYQVSWVVDRVKSEVTFTVSVVSGSKSAILGFSLTNNFLDADVIKFVDFSGLSYGYDYYTTDDSDFIRNEDSSDLDDFDYSKDNFRSVFTFTRPIKNDSRDDISLQQCVYVIWGYDTINFSNSYLSDFNINGIFPQQLCLQGPPPPPPPCPTKGTSTCEKRIMEVGCRSLKLKDPDRQLPRSCSAS